MAILRMRRKRPDLKPEQYYDQDEDFKNFIDCKPYDPQAAAPPLCTMFISPLYTKFDDTCPAKHFRYYMRRKMGPPGGAICVDAKDLASCRRFD
eukprot:XP_001699868.1 predicted protein [Chlamydomonas reinhardtii]